LIQEIEIQICGDEMKHNVKFSSKTAFQLLIVLIWVQSLLLNYIRAFITHIPIVGLFPDLIINFVFMLLIALSLREIKLNKFDFLFYLAIAVIFLLHWILYRENAIYIEDYVTTFLLQIVTLYFLGLNLGNSDDRDLIIHQLYVASSITLIATIGYQFLFAAPMETATSVYVGNMDLAYKLLPHCCLIAYYAIKRTSIYNLILTVVGGFYLLMLGTRGAALIFLILITILIIMGKKSKWSIARSVLIFGGLAAFISSSWYDSAILWFYQKAQQLGLSVRIFDKLLAGEVTNSSGRDLIHEQLLTAIAENPFFGMGLCADRLVTGTYAHNLVIELYVEFGVIFGTVLFIAIIILLIKGVLCSPSEEATGLVLALSFACVLKLFFSGSYLDERLLFFLIGLCMSNIRRHKIH
jgi:O-antigen ligase